MTDRLLVLVRHGESEWNKKNLFTGWRDVDLTEAGIAEARNAGRKLKAQGLTFDIGWVGAVAVLGLLALIVLGGMLIALRCRNPFGRLVALGISFNFFMYVFVNIAMVMGVIPVGGVPLPMVSHGGSAMLTVMFGFGLLMSVHVHRDVEFSTGREE